MKRLLTAAALALLTTAAHAGDEVIAFGISATIAYDEKCEALPHALKETALLAMQTVSADTMQAAMQRC